MHQSPCFGPFGGLVAGGGCVAGGLVAGGCVAGCVVTGGCVAGGMDRLGAVGMGGTVGAGTAIAGAAAGPATAWPAIGAPVGAAVPAAVPVRPVAAGGIGATPGCARSVGGATPVIAGVSTSGTVDETPPPTATLGSGARWGGATTADWAATTPIAPMPITAPIAHSSRRRLASSRKRTRVTLSHEATKPLGDALSVFRHELPVDTSDCRWATAGNGHGGTPAFPAVAQHANRKDEPPVCTTPHRISTEELVLNPRGPYRAEEQRSLEPDRVLDALLARQRSRKMHHPRSRRPAVRRGLADLLVGQGSILRERRLTRVGLSARPSRAFRLFHGLTGRDSNGQVPLPSSWARRVPRQRRRPAA